MKSKEKCILVTSDFVESQYLWLIPILEGFLQKQKINKIIFEKKFSNTLMKDIYVKKFIKKYNILFVNENKFLRIIKIIPMIITNLKDILIKTIFFKNLMNYKNQSWYELQINHGIWDYVNLHIDEKNFKKNIKNKLTSIILNYEKINFSQKIIKQHNLKYAFMGHSVYTSRSLFASLRINNIKVFTQASFNIYGQDKLNDNNWGDIKKKKFNSINKKKSFINDSKNYWKSRTQGRGSYEDSKIAAISSTKKKLEIRNFVFLHIFKDSPFNTIDNTRIFIDYFDWISSTIKIISKSDEIWEFRFHPSHKKWGENQKYIFDTLLRINLINDNNNIYYDFSKNSNNEIFKVANKIVTFSGTSQYEAVANGIKPIIISSSPLYKFDQDVVHKPRSIRQYEKLLLSKDLTLFKNSENKILLARNMIFFRENILRIKDMVGGIDTYRNDSLKIFNNNYIQTQNGIHKNYDYLFESGLRLLDENTIYSNLINKYLNIKKPQKKKVNIFKILHLSYSNYFGGANVAAYRIFKSQKNSGANVKFLLIKQKQKEKNIIKYKYDYILFNETLRNYIVRILDIFNYNKDLNSYNILPSNIHNLINNSDYDIINFHWINNEMLSLKEISEIKKNIVWTFHDMWPLLGSEHYKAKRKKSLTNSLLENFNFSNYTKLKKMKYFSKVDINIISPSQWLKNEIVNNNIFKDNKIEVIRNPIDTKFWKITKLQKDDELIKFLFVSVNPYDDPRKGFLDIFNVLKKLNVKVYIMGSNEVKLKLPKNFKNIGYISNKEKLRAIYNSCDAVIIPSKQDNLPNVALEAMACGIPVISSINSGLKEVIKHKFNGLVLEKFNISNLEKACLWLKNNKKLNKRIRIRNNCIKEFSYENISQNYLKFYREVIDGKKNKHHSSNL